MDWGARKTNNKVAALLGLVVIGLPVFMLTFYALIMQTYFVYHATAFEAPVVEVGEVSVKTGKVSKVRYFPVVEIPDQSGNKVRTRVGDSKEKSVWRVGQQMPVLCDRSSLTCVEHTFFKAWGKSALMFVLSAVLVSVFIILLWRV